MFLANFVVEILPVLLIGAAVMLIVRARKGGPGRAWRYYLGVSLASLPSGIFLYILSGILAARIRQEGHFYSVPFGGYTVSDNTAIGFSLLTWIALVFALLTIFVRRRRQDL